jgi:acyl-coenzyme A synthetase/AMP-(fatty) acid ligase
VSLANHHNEKQSSEVQLVLDNVRKWFDGQVAGYKKMRGGIHHLQALPKTTSGKILRRNLPAKIREQRENKL